MNQLQAHVEGLLRGDVGHLDPRRVATLALVCGFAYGAVMGAYGLPYVEVATLVWRAFAGR